MQTPNHRHRQFLSGGQNTRFRSSIIMGVGPAAAGLHSLNSEVLALVLKTLKSNADTHSLLCTSRAVRDTVLLATGCPQGPLLTCSLPTPAWQHLNNSQICMQLWLKDGSLLRRSCATAVKAVGCAQLCINGCPGSPARAVTQLMAGGGPWHGLTVIHFRHVVLEQLVPDVLTRNCPHLKTLHLKSFVYLLGLGVAYRAHAWASISATGGSREPNPNLNLQECVSSSVTQVMQPCPQLQHLTLGVWSAWPDLRRQYMDSGSLCIELEDMMDKLWYELDAVPRAVIQLQLTALSLQQQPEQSRQLKTAASKLQASWERAFEKRISDLVLAMCKLEHQQDEYQDVCMDYEDPPEVLADTYGAEPASSDTTTQMLKQAEQLQAVTDMDSDGMIRQQIEALEVQVSCRRDHHIKQGKAVKKWWGMRDRLLMYHSNVKVAQQMHQQLGMQVQQQLAALPNLSSITIPEAKHLPHNTAHHVLQLGSQLTSLELGSTRSLYDQLQLSAAVGTNKYKETRKDTLKAIMPQQLASLCTQLTSLVCLQWDALVTDEGITTLLQLPSLCHVTIVTNLSKSFADAACSWHTLTTMHTHPPPKQPEDSSSPASSTCQQLAYLPLRSLQQRVQVLALGWGPVYKALLPCTTNAAADLLLVQQAVSNVARCGGVAWILEKEGVYSSKHVPDTPSIHHQVGNPPHGVRLQVLEACLPLLGKPTDGYAKTVVSCDPLNADVMGVLVPWLGSMQVHSLDLLGSVVSPDLMPRLLAMLPPTIHHVDLNYYPERDSEPAAQLLHMSTAAVHHVHVALKHGNYPTYDKAFDKLMKQKTTDGAFGQFTTFSLRTRVSQWLFATAGTISHAVPVDALLGHVVCWLQKCRVFCQHALLKGASYAKDALL